MNYSEYNFFIRKKLVKMFTLTCFRSEPWIYCIVIKIVHQTLNIIWKQTTTLSWKFFFVFNKNSPIRSLTDIARNEGRSKVVEEHRVLDNIGVVNVSCPVYLFVTNNSLRQDKVKDAVYSVRYKIQFTSVINWLLLKSLYIGHFV